MSTEVADDPRIAEAHALFEKTLYADAARLCREILETRPDEPRINNLLGVMHLRAGDHAQAALLFRQALRHAVDDRIYTFNLALACREAGDLKEALVAAERCTKAWSDSAAVLVDLADIYRRGGRLVEAAACARRAFQLEPKAGTAVLLGTLLRRLGRPAHALRCFNKALELEPAHPRAHLALAACLVYVAQFANAKAVCERALAQGHASAELYSNLGIIETALGHPVDAVAAYRKALEIDPANRIAISNMANVIAHLCEWDEAEKYQRAAVELTLKAIDANERFSMMPFTALTLDLAPSVQRRITAHYARIAAPAAVGYTPGSASTKSPIVVGYLSSDFRDHPVMHLAQNLFRHHDRGRFRIIGYSSGPDDGSEYRRHIQRGCDAFVDIRTMSAEEAKRRIAADGVDILVDMTGYTALGRLDVLALRPAPLQIHFLGYPGTLATPAVDYFVTDHFLTPPEARSHFAEKLIYMPDTYQISDDEQRPAEATVTRAGEGLPDAAFVYCAFSSSYKIEPRIFGCWTEILRRVPNAVLWLVATNDVVAANLRAAARSRGVDEARLVVARRADKRTHLARHRLADLFLDTWIVCGHTTANDALQMGLPLIACPRESFISRVSATLLRAHGLNELVCESLDAYVDLAVALAGDSARLAALRERLQQGARIPARDTARFVRHLERAYTRVLELHRSGRLPEDVDVAALAAG